MCLSTSRLLSGLGCVRSTRDKPSSTRLRANAADSPRPILGSSSGISALSGGHCRSLSTAAAIRRASIPAKEEPIAHGPALPLRRPLRIALVAVAVGVCAGAVVRSIFDTAVFNRSATRSANQANLPISVQTEPAKSQAQDTELNELKAKIWEAEVAQRNFAAGLPHCSELNGTNFYFSQQNRLLNLQDYRRSLDNLVTQGVFNRQDADARWAQVQNQASTDQANCTAVASLPSLRQKLKELQQRP